MWRQDADHHENQLTCAESDQPGEGAVHETVGVQSDAEHVHAKPGPARDDIAENRHHHQAALPNESAPAGVEDDGIPENDEERAVFLRIPAPETAP